MSKLDELIKKLCPNGVKYFSISELCNISRGRIVSKEYLRDNIGEYPVYSSQTENNGELGKITTYDYEGEYLTWTTDGANAGSVFYRNGKFSITNVCGLLKVINENIIAKFLYYILSIESPKYVNAGMGNPKLMNNVMAKIKVPVPPLEIQRKIIHILDNFTLLSEQLSAELKARQKQYHYYRENLLKFSKSDSTIKWVNLGTYCRRLTGTAITAGKMKQIAKDDGSLKIFAGGKTVITTDENNIPKEDIIKIPNIIVQSRGVIDFIYYDKSCSYKREMWSYTNDNIVTLKYIYYYLKSNVEFFRQKGSQMGSMPQISLNITEKYQIPIPKYEKQVSIVNTLDKFDKLCHDISEGLPAEIKARQKQYEYYRNKLLTFKEQSK